jgi:predicted dehydrogenase
MTMKRYGMAVIGLGVVGRRMLEQAGKGGGVQVVAAWDASSQARAAALADFPGLPMCASADEAIERLDVDIVYVAVPPLAHGSLVRAAIAARKAVFCEKPLGVDLADSIALTDEIGRSGLGQAVNFVFASTAAVEALRRAVLAPAFGLRAVEIRTRFHEWPRAWQAGATWLERSDQGGFTREVLSHYVYLLRRMFGEVDLIGADVVGPAGSPEAAETALAATLACSGVPVTIAASVGGAAPDLIEARFVGAAAELRLSDWYRLEVFDASSAQGRALPGLPSEPRGATYLRQLEQLHAMLSGEPHTLPDFGDALAVQRIVEAMLARRR